MPLDLLAFPVRSGLALECLLDNCKNNHSYGTVVIETLALDNPTGTAGHIKGDAKTSLIIKKPTYI